MLTDSATLAIEALLSASAFAALITALFKLLSDSLQDSREQSTSIWKHINSQIATHYWPLVMAAWGVRGSTRRFLDGVLLPSDPVIGAFHWYAQFAAIRDNMSRQKAWILLPHTDAESWTQDLAIMLLDRPGLSDFERSVLSSRTALDQPLKETMNQIVTDPDIKPLYDKFATWMRDPKSVDLLNKMYADAEYFCDLMSSECNRIYSKWYGRDYALENYRIRKQVRKYVASEP